MRKATGHISFSLMIDVVCLGRNLRTRNARVDDFLMMRASAASVRGASTKMSHLRFVDDGCCASGDKHAQTKEDKRAHR